MEYAYTVTGYMGNENSTGGPQEIKSGCIPKAIIKKVAENVASDLKKEYKVVASGKVIIPFESEGFLIDGEFIGDIFREKFGDKSIEEIEILTREKK